MKLKIKIARIFLSLCSVVCILYGLLYIMTPRILPYHEHVLGLMHEDLPPKVAYLMLQMMGIIGTGFFSTGVLLLYLLNGPIKQKIKSGWKTAFILVSVFIFPIMIRVLMVGEVIPSISVCGVFIGSVYSLYLLRYETIENTEPT